MSKILKSEKGISLIEIMASMVVFALGLLMLIPMMIASINANEFANDLSDATLLAQQKLEELRSASVLSSGNDIVDSKNRTWTVVDIAANLKRVTVSVNWYDVGNRLHHIQTITYEVR
jgi:Tfp pilus assembly protein PilV